MDGKLGLTGNKSTSYAWTAYLIVPRMHTMCYITNYVIVKSLQCLFLIYFGLS